MSEQDNDFIIDNDELYGHMSEVEESGGFAETIYYCTSGVPTIGVGFALIVNNNVRDDLFLEGGIFDQAGVDLPDEDTVNSIERILTRQVAEQLNRGNVQAAKDIIDENEDVLNELTITEENSEELFQITQERYEDILIERIERNAGVSNQRAEEIIENLSNDEQIALFSCVYNATTLIGPGLSSALDEYTSADNDRDEAHSKTSAWYEIRYNSHRNGWRYINGEIDENDDDANGINGLANRRYKDSLKFGLYGLCLDEGLDVDNADEDEIKEGILNFLEDNNGRNNNQTLETIREYEEEFNPDDRNLGDDRQRYIDDILEDLQEEQNPVEAIEEEVRDDGRMMDNLTYEFLEEYHGEYSLALDEDDKVYSAVSEIKENEDVLIFSLMDKLVIKMEQEEQQAKDQDDMQKFKAIREFRDDCKTTLEQVVKAKNYRKSEYKEINDRDLTDYDFKMELIEVFKLQRFNSPDTEESHKFFESFITEEDKEKQRAEREKEKERERQKERKRLRAERKEKEKRQAREAKKRRKEEEERRKKSKGWIICCKDGERKLKSRKDYYGV